MPLDMLKVGRLLELGVLRAPGIGEALVRQPGVQFLERLHLRTGPEEDISHRADLVLDLPLLPA